jgi:hypothetical protein
MLAIGRLQDFTAKMPPQPLGIMIAQNSDQSMVGRHTLGNIQTNAPPTAARWRQLANQDQSLIATDHIRDLLRHTAQRWRIIVRRANHKSAGISWMPHADTTDRKDCN